MDGEWGALFPFVQLGATGLLCVILLALLRAWLKGQIVAQRELDYLRQDRDARVAEARQEAADWRAAHETSEHARQLLNQQNRDLAEGLRTFDHFFSSFRAVLDKIGEEDVRKA